jgi:cobalamin biosynthesis protein CobT
MSDSVRELPHEVLLRKYNLQVSELSNHTQQMKKDLDKTITFLINKSKNGSVNITPTTQSKIETYDRFICDGIFEYLENEEVISDQQSTQLKSGADKVRTDKVDDLVDDLEDSEDDSNKDTNPDSNNNQNNSQSQSNSNDNSSESSNTEGGARIGFWDWK